MAGSEKTGIRNSKRILLENAYYILTPTKEVDPALVEKYRELVISLKALPLILSCEEHDLSTAAISHLPHLIAASLVNLVKDSDSEKQTMKTIAAGGFKDITRIASSSPEMWEQICATNRDNILIMLNRYIESLEDIRKELTDRNKEGIHNLFAESQGLPEFDLRFFPGFSSEKLSPSTAIWWMKPEESPPWPPSSPPTASASKTSVSSTTVNLRKRFFMWNFMKNLP